VHVTIVGVAHVLDIEKKIGEILEGEAPEGVAIELDPSRLYALLNPEKAGKGDAMSRALGNMEKRMADEYGVMPGSEMLAAFEYARAKALPLYLIDKNISETMNGMRKIRLRERVKLIFSSLYAALMPRKRMEREMRKVIDEYDSAMSEFHKSFPELTKVLIDDRNDYMVSRLLSTENEKIVAVVGDAHVEGIAQGLRKAGVDVKVIRLKEITSI